MGMRHNHEAQPLEDRPTLWLKLRLNRRPSVEVVWWNYNIVEFQVIS